MRERRGAGGHSETQRGGGDKMIAEGSAKILCPVCSWVLVSPSALEDHMRQHGKSAVYRCHTADKPGVLVSHRRGNKIISEGSAKILCPVCNWVLVSPSALEDHMKQHVKSAVYRCDDCPYTADKPSVLVEHRRTHTGERPYRCGVCAKAFRVLGYLRSHQRIHTGEKPYKCGVCGRAFADKSTHRRHKKTHATPSDADTVADTVAADTVTVKTEEDSDDGVVG
ncbi:zinc finger protein 726-like isoform X2 [Lethenteron reissneri]|uniref:zinc finger protein 726-like isoform X2 n=1 Tax=Lethenteron reissneri TaxID=7753 RepID=UPI002AB5E282|nr:zinc finger protein 726-like isoform X2 [Lethenteron reissneri]